jgi:tetratricopeptide (TPR) repeat protein
MVYRTRFAAATLPAGFLEAKGRFDEAISELRDALILDPLSTRYISHLGQAYYFARRSNEAIGQYRQALELDPKDASVHQWLGDAYQRIGDGRGALAEWRTALTLTGESVVAKRISDIWSTRGIAAAVPALALSKLERWIRQKKRGPAMRCPWAASRVCTRHRLCPRSRIANGDKKAVVARDLDISRETLYQYLRQANDDTRRSL